MADSRLRTYDELYNADYKKQAAKWQLCDDCFSGEEAVKAKWQDYIDIPKAKQNNEQLRKAYISRGKFPEFGEDVPASFYYAVARKKRLRLLSEVVPGGTVK